MINWKVRILNKTFWLTLVPALALLIQTFLAVFGVNLELGETIDKVLGFINALFAVRSYYEWCKRQHSSNDIRFTE